MSVETPRDVGSDLVAALREDFDRIELLERALTHGSWTNANDEASENYERLEFLGDAVLGLVIVDALYRRFPNEAEGNLSRAKASLVSARQLSALARDHGLEQHVRLSGSAGGLSRRGRDSILADVFEAVIGAVYLDRGFDEARAWLLAIYAPIIETLDPDAQFSDYKSALQERTQGLLRQRPEYRVKQAGGPSHKPIFHASVVLEGVALGQGTGPSKKLAEQNAASDALSRIERGEVSLSDLLDRR